MSEQENKALETADQTVEEAAEESVKAAEQQKAVTAKKSDKPVAKKKKPNVFARIGKWFHDLAVEAKKVVWPSKKQVVNNTIVVIVCIIAVCIVVTVLDVTFGAIRDFIARLV